MPPVKPMLANAVPKIPEGEMSFEPKWDGFRCIIFRDGDEILLGSRNEKPLTRYFPELLEPIRSSMPDRCVIDGEIIITVDDRLGFDQLQQRIHPAESRVAKLSVETPAEFVAFDLLALGDGDLTTEHFTTRRMELARIGDHFADPIHLIASTRDRTIAHDWWLRFEGAGLDGLIAKPLDGVYLQNKRSQFKIKHTRTADVVVAGYRIHKDGEGVGSLLVGLHDRAGNLQHMGVAASFSKARRSELLAELSPLRVPADHHPWAAWIDPEAHTGTLMPGAPSRWSSGRSDQSWEALACDQVAEVKYEAVLNGRFRGTTRLVRWRPDRDAESCGYDQLEVPVPVAISEVLSAQG